MNKLLAILLLALSIAGCEKEKSQEVSEDISAWRVAESDPIATVGHGAIFNHEGEEINPSPEAVIDAQRFYLKKLYGLMDERRRGEFIAAQRGLNEFKSRSQSEDILANAALIARFIDAAEQREAPFLASKNAALLARFVRITDDGVETKDPPSGGIRKEFFDYLRRQNLLTFYAATNAGGASYLEECRKSGVPLPSDWGSPNWQSRGKLNMKFISSGIEAELFAIVSESPRGVCFALPRSAGDTISLLGIICLGVDTSKSCYWDNQRNKQQYDIPKNTPVSISGFAGGADLQGGTGGVCTDCHAGENPYIVHPAEPMDLGSKIIPKTWLEPLVHPSWPQNPGPTNALQGITLTSGESSCSSCHDRPPGRRFPEVSTATPGYCSIILPKAIKFTMPPSNPGNNASYAKHKDALTAACAQPPSGGIVINGATQTEPTSSRSDTGGDLSACAPSGDCPLGFCYWRTLHGPFWQTTKSEIPIGDANYRGGFARIYADGGKWKWRAFVDPTGGPATAPPGGTAECVNYNQIASVPDPKNCYANMFIVFDPDGSRLAQNIDATVTGAASANVLSGFIGNVAIANADKRPDKLHVFETAGKIALLQEHAPPSGLRPMTGESWTNGCAAWSPPFAATEVLSTSDVQLAPSDQANDVRCYITGITGAWASTRDGGKAQPFAEIYKGPNKDIRLRVSPAGENDRVGAYASCVRLK
jgi:hypothetical protein